MNKMLVNMKKLCAVALVVLQLPPAHALEDYV